MRLLIFTLALISAFFVSAEPDMDDLVSPEDLPVEFACSTSFTLSNGDSFMRTPDAESCINEIKQSVQHLRGVEYVGLGTYSFKTTVIFNYNGADVVYGDFYSVETALSCPPTSNPEYSIPVDLNGSLMCAKQLVDKDCPAGYHSKAVSKAMGSDSCMPKECPSSGTGEDLYSSKLTGGIPFNGGGMYCNDGCAYHVKSENVTSDQYALGTSQGVACGDKPYDNKKLADEGNDGQCETNTVDGVSVMFCNNEPAPPTDKDDDANNDPSKGDETEKPKKELENCASDDNACMMRNLIKEQSNNTQVQIESDTKLHNRMVDTATNNTNVIKSTLENFNTSFDIHARGVKSSQTIEFAKLDSIISTLKAGNQIAIDKPVGGGSGGSGGSGNGANEGTCVGEGCSENSKYNGECEGALCDEDIVPKLESVDTEITEWFNEKITIPAEITSSFTNMRNFISSNFASFNGTCTPFTLDVSIAGNSKSITVNQHCEPYETYFKPLVEWLLWTLTAMTLFSMFAQVFRSFSRI